MKYHTPLITAVLLVSLFTGCSSMPGSSAAERRFLSEHPNATVLSETKNDEFEPHDATRCFADFGFVYRNADGTEHEEVLHYKRSTHGWYLAKNEQIR
jgi:hypothetical protein